MKESKFNTEIMNSLKAGSAWCYKIPDSPTSWTLRRTRFTPEKPCDIIACFGGNFLAIEGKQIRKWQSFGLSQMRPSQIRNLDQITTTGKGRGFVFLNVRINRPYENRLIIFDWAEWRHSWEIASMTAKELKQMPYIQGSKDLYPLVTFLASIQPLKKN